MDNKKPSWSVVEVQAREDFTLLLTFASGEHKIYDARQLFDLPVCAPLKDVDFFLTAKSFFGTVAWGDIDIAPEHLYEVSIPYNPEDFVVAASRCD